MHEIGIASSILETVDDEARRRPDSQIIAVGLRIGELSNIDKGALVYNEDLKAWKPYQAAEWALNLALTVWEESLGISE